MVADFDTVNEEWSTWCEGFPCPCHLPSNFDDPDIRLELIVTAAI